MDLLSSPRLAVLQSDWTFTPTTALPQGSATFSSTGRR